MLLCTILIPHVEASISRVLATSTINKRQWGLSFTEHKRAMGRINKGNLYLNHINVINRWEDKNSILLVILMFYYCLAWKNASVFYASKKRTCRISFIYKKRWFSTRPQLQFKSATRQAFDQFISMYKFTEFLVRIYYDRCSFRSADHFSGTEAVPRTP